MREHRALILASIASLCLLAACGANTAEQGVQTQVQQAGAAKAAVARSNLSVAEQAATNILLQAGASTTRVNAQQVMTGLNSQGSGLLFTTGESTSTTTVSVLVSGQQITLATLGGGSCWFVRVSRVSHEYASVSEKSTCAAANAPANSWTSNTTAA